MNSDLENRLFHEAQSQPVPAQSALVERIIAQALSPTAANADPVPLPGPTPRFHPVPMAIAAAIIAAITLGILARQSHPTAITAQHPAPLAAIPPAPPASATTLSLPALEWTSPWTITVANPLNTELALLEEDLRSASRFLTDSLPFQAHSLN